MARDPFRVGFSAVVLAAATALGSAQEADERFVVHFQLTTVTQGHPAFDAPYSGSNSLSPSSERETTVTSTLFTGARLWNGAEIHADAELSGGSGISHAFGIAGFPNGESFRVGDAQPRIYLARAFLRQVLSASGSPAEESEEGDLDRLAGKVPVRRWVVTIGRIGVSDLFDDNAYSHDPRTQFLNWADWTAGAFDYPADTRGYTWLASLAYESPVWSVRLAGAAEPRDANGQQFGRAVSQSYSLLLESDRKYRLRDRDGVVRLVLFRNRARMGDYREAVRDEGLEGPDVTATRRVGRLKWGAVLNLQQALGERSGVFFRGSWNDGKTESWAYAEIDRSVTAGVSLKAPIRARPNDTAGAAAIVNALSAPHRDYLAAGGYGFMIGDGRLRYGYEEIAEAYYAAAVVEKTTLTVDYQLVLHPAYNRDRGPVHIVAVRFHVEL